ncbi:MAG TPA: LEA type 2 family protein [Longimicrobiales bacterium]|nr:LEA type 2 family protein [Longimicrobiales bacterium]
MTRRCGARPGPTPPAGRRPIGLRGAVLTLALAVSGCAFGFEQPTLRVTEVRLAAVGLSGGTLTVRLDVDNPNDYPLEGERFRYRLAFADERDGSSEWVTLADGSLDDRIRVPANGTGSVDVDVPFEFASAGMALSSLLRSGELEYRFSGEIRVRGRLGGSRIPFDERGVFSPGGGARDPHGGR